MVEDKVQDSDSSACGIFQLYFYDNLFNPNENSKIQDKTKLNTKQLKHDLMKFCFRQPTSKGIRTQHRYNYIMDVFYPALRKFCKYLDGRR